MKKVLFMPFLQIPSGHHQVADSLMDGLMTFHENIHCEKVDILQYGYGKLEKLISGVYLKWIKHLPKTYSWLYQKSVCEEKEEDKRYRHYELLFLSVMQSIVKEHRPDVIVCTHALPSYILSQLKQQGLVNATIVNVYTDFFINDLWGLKGIDIHFVPTDSIKKILRRRGINPSSIYVTGIPVHHQFIRGKTVGRHEWGRRHLLMTGGNLGVGLMEKFIDHLQSDQIFYSVLCGKNEKLYKRLTQLNRFNIQPITFIEDRDEMDKLYSECDGIITKPGGVTISESLYKGIPIFVYHTLPGQEEMNLKELQHLGVAIDIQAWEKTQDLEKDILSFYENEKELQKYNSHLKMYQEQIEHGNPVKLIAEI